VYSERLLDHFQNPRNAGSLGGSAIVVEVENPACGDILRLEARVEDGRIAEIRYKVRGCTASIAAGSALTGLVLGRDAAGLRQLRAADIEDEVGGLIPESKHAAVLCLDGARALAGRIGQ